ncbi:protein of unknown function [Pseudodesulfovibrio piezophilus C1TLV30]|uniref:Uncharacterized protein n=1 Tax=Pseudodesulfovibrio piezophilus (strain DSM 21447 / JCM 15486 / C1TLV30) TaxID=1322246 RepID=M1WTD8_PSEP2|nr:protein of unknown function [Pseudodesulfovibrio piezophilus C1TLV30]
MDMDVLFAKFQTYIIHIRMNLF